MKLVRNAIQTPDGTVLESRHVHDYQSYFDPTVNEVYVVDGGLEYIRGSVNYVKARDLCVYVEDGHETVRDSLTWGTRGVDGDQPLRYIKLKDMTTDHIIACLDTQSRMHPTYRECFLEELKYRGVEYDR